MLKVDVTRGGDIGTRMGRLAKISTSRHFLKLFSSAVHHGGIMECCQCKSSARTATRCACFPERK